MSPPTKNAHETCDQQMIKIVVGVEMMVDVIGVTRNQQDLMMTMMVGEPLTTTLVVINLQDDEDKVHVKDIRRPNPTKTLISGTICQATSVHPRSFPIEDLDQLTFSEICYQVMQLDGARRAFYSDIESAKRIPQNNMNSSSTFSLTSSRP